MSHDHPASYDLLLLIVMDPASCREVHTPHVMVGKPTVTGSGPIKAGRSFSVNNSNVYFPSASRVGRLTLYCQTSRGDFEQDQQASGAAQERRVRALHLRCRKFYCIALMVNMGCLMLWVHADFTHLVPLARRMLTPRQQAGLEIPSRC
jgi:hypothetical protein